MKYLLDFDRTLFDMESLYEEISKVNPELKLGSLESLKNINLERFIFSDAVEFLKTHPCDSIEIVSSCFGKTKTWNLDYQKEKIARTGVQKFVKNVHVVSESKVEVIKSIVSHGTIVFVDDLVEHLDDVKNEVPNVKTFLINRKRECFDKNSEHIEISNLSEIDDIINKL